MDKKYFVRKVDEMKRITQTAGRNALKEFSLEFAHFNDDILFGENWNNQDIDLKTRSIITVVALMSSGITDSSLIYHLQNAKEHGVTQKEIAAIITHVAFYTGWPKGWAVFNLAKEVWQPKEGDLPYEDEGMRAHAKSMVFPIGEPNDAFAKYFVGQSYLAPITTEQVGIFNVTFEPGCRNNWHIHHAKSGGFPDTHTVPPVKARPSHFPQIVVQPGLERKILRGKHIAASRSIRQLRILCQKAYHIHPEPVCTAIQPAVHHPVDFLPKFGIFPVQIRLLLGEQMQIPLCCGLVIAPG